MKIANPTARLGEDKATEYLRKKGYKIIERNFRKGYGEIDIIALSGGSLVFIEVKSRISENFGDPLESISYFKLKTLIKTVEFYKLLHPNLPNSMRMDAISVKLSGEGKVLEIRHIENITS